MSEQLTVILHDVETDGLPDMENDDLTGRVAFIWDGCIVSGWPIGAEFGGIEGGQQKWEPSEDRFGGPVVGVKQWLELPSPAWRLDAAS